MGGINTDGAFGVVDLGKIINQLWVMERVAKGDWEDLAESRHGFTGANSVWRDEEKGKLRRR